MMIIHKKTNIDRPNRGLEALHFARLCDVTGVQRTKWERMRWNLPFSPLQSPESWFLAGKAHRKCKTASHRKLHGVAA
jgi:hypothetical protein